MKIVYVEWVDPTLQVRRYINIDYDYILQKTAGILVKEDKKNIRIALVIGENYGDYIDIPKCLIRKKRC